MVEAPSEFVPQKSEMIQRQVGEETGLGSVCLHRAPSPLRPWASDSHLEDYVRGVGENRMTSDTCHHMIHLHSWKTLLINHSMFSVRGPVSPQNPSQAGLQDQSVSRTSRPQLHAR